MIRLSYVSRTDRDMTDDELATIISTARRKNAAADITGMLVYENRTFLQILEGPERAVQACFDRISRDTRHSGLNVLQKMDTQTRLFGNWSMGLANPAALPASERQNAKSLVQIASRLEQVKGPDAPSELRRVALRVESFLKRAKSSVVA